MYESFFELARRPFVSTPNPDCCLAHHDWGTARSDLKACIERNQGIGVITGPPGVGKTLLLASLADEFSHSAVVVLLPHGNFLTRRAMLQAILGQLDKPYGRLSEQELRLELTPLLKSCQAEGKKFVLLCDEAHQLSPILLEELRILADSNEHGESLAHVILAGTLEFEERIIGSELIAFSQRIGKHVVLGPLTRADSLDYIDYRLTWGNGRTSDIFTPEALDVIVEVSDGLPRCLNQLCDHALLLAYVAETKPVTARTVKEALLDLRQLPLPWNEPAISRLLLIEEASFPSDGHGHFDELPDAIDELGDDASDLAPFSDEDNLDSEFLVDGESTAVPEKFAVSAVTATAEASHLEAVAGQEMEIRADTAVFEFGAGAGTELQTMAADEQLPIEVAQLDSASDLSDSTVPNNASSSSIEFGELNDDEVLDSQEYQVEQPEIESHVAGISLEKLIDLELQEVHVDSGKELAESEADWQHEAELQLENVLETHSAHYKSVEDRLDHFLEAEAAVQLQHRLEERLSMQVQQLKQQSAASEEIVFDRYAAIDAGLPLLPPEAVVRRSARHEPFSAPPVSSFDGDHWHRAAVNVAEHFETASIATSANGTSSDSGFSSERPIRAHSSDDPEVDLAFEAINLRSDLEAALSERADLPFNPSKLTPNRPEDILLHEDYPTESIAYAEDGDDDSLDDEHEEMSAVEPAQQFSENTSQSIHPPYGNGQSVSEPNATSGSIWSQPVQEISEPSEPTERPTLQAQYRNLFSLLRRRSGR